LSPAFLTYEILFIRAVYAAIIINKINRNKAKLLNILPITTGIIGKNGTKEIIFV